MVDLRRCSGSARFGIEAHDASPEDFPAQPSGRAGLGRMCTPHWNQYTRALRAAALAPSVIDRRSDPAIEAGGTVSAKPVRAKPVRRPEPIRTRVPRQRRKAETLAEVAQEPAAG